MIGKLYTRILQDNNNVFVQLADSSHPLFEAHFPKYPLLPGFALIDIMATLFEDEIVTIHKSKFIKNIFPNDILECEVSKSEKKRKIKIFRRNVKVSEIIYETK